MSASRPISFEGDVDLDALQRIDPRLVALALGHIDDDELDELMDRAVREPEIQRAVEAFWPLSDEARRSSFARAKEALSTEVRAPQQPHWALMFVPTGLAGSLVAVLVVVIGTVVQPRPLPDYRLEVRGGLRTMRTMRSGGGDFVLGRMAPTAPLELVFRPSEAIEGEASAALFRVDPDNSIVRLNAVPQVSSSGSVRWRGPVGILLNHMGERAGVVELIMAVRSGGQAPTVDDVRRTLARPSKSLRLEKTTLVLDSP